jgi:hypothetical protein
MVNRKIRIYFFAIIAIVFAFIAGTDDGNLLSNPAEEKGVVNFVSGRVKKKNIANPDWLKVSKNSEVLSGEKVRTYRKSLAEIEFLGLDIIRIAPETIIDVVKLYQESKNNVVETNIKIEKGDLWINLEKRKKNLTFHLETPVAGAVITGTKFRVSVAQDSSSEIRVYQGSLVVSNYLENVDSTKIQPKEIQRYEIEPPREIPGPEEVTKEKWALIVKEMQRVRIGRKGNISYSGEFKSDESEERSEWVRWNQTRDQNR